MITTFKQNGLEHISLENELLKVIFLPEIGGKMIKLINKRTNTNFLLEPHKEYKHAFHGAPFENYDASGFDECFPTIEACEITTESGMKIKFPDHGQLWSKAWDYEIVGRETFIRTTKGINWNYVFKKIISLEGNKLTIDYEVENFEDEPLPYIWAAHPLLNVEPGDEIYLPEEVRKAFTGWTNDKSIGSEVEWSYIDNKNDFSVVQPAEFGKAVKLFSHQLKEHGWAALHKIKNKESFLISFDTAEIPFLGVWLCYGGWPPNGEPKHLTIALEPSNACCDSLAEAMQKKLCSVVGPHKKNIWQIEIAIVNEQ